MSVPFSNTTLRVPAGLQGLLEGVAKEVLQMQPTDIYAFAAVYFENLVKYRDEGGPDPANNVAKIQDRLYNNTAFQNPDVDSTSPRQQEAAVTIQSKYRQFQAKTTVDEMRHDVAATKIQAGVRGYKARKRVKNIRMEMEMNGTKADLDDEDPELQRLMQEDDLDLTDKDQQDAANKIQAGIKAYKVRKEYRSGGGEAEVEELAPSAPPEETEEAAETTDIETQQTTEDQSMTPEVVTHVVETDDGAEADRKSADDLVKEDIELDTETKEAVNETPREDQDETVAETEELNPESDEAVLTEQTVIDDPELEQAILKIQAGFQGMKVRQELKNKKQEQNNEVLVPEEQPEVVDSETVEVTNENEITEAGKDVDPQREEAINKIQAGFRGYKTRKDGKEKITGDMDDKDIDAEAQEEIDELPTDQTETDADEHIEEANIGDETNIDRTTEDQVQEPVITNEDVLGELQEEKAQEEGEDVDTARTNRSGEEPQETERTEGGEEVAVETSRTEGDDDNVGETARTEDEENKEADAGRIEGDEEMIPDTTRTEGDEDKVVETARTEDEENKESETARSEREEEKETETARMEGEENKDDEITRTEREEVEPETGRSEREDEVEGETARTEQDEEVRYGGRAPSETREENQEAETARTDEQDTARTDEDAKNEEHHSQPTTERDEN